MSTHKTLSPLDPQQFRLVQSSALTAKATHPNGRKFIASIDVVWVRQARQLGVTALFVGLALWHLKGLRRSNTFIVSNMMLEDWGVTKWAKLRSLRSLEKAGLVAIEWRGKRSPLVTLVMPAGDAATLTTTGHSDHLGSVIQTAVNAEPSKPHR